MSSSPSLSSFPYAKPAETVLSQLHVKTETGIATNQVRERRAMFGANILPQRLRSSLWGMLGARFKDALVLLLIFAAGISFYLGHTADAVIIIIAVGLDVALSFIQSWRVERTLSHMQQRVSDTATVMRGGRLQQLAAAELVVGDIIHLRAGRHVPADARLISIRALRAQEAALTGEASDVLKSVGHVPERSTISGRHNMVFAGTSVTAGSGTAVVTAVGPKTEFGKIANSLGAQVSPDTPLRRSLQTIALFLGGAVIIVGACLIGINLLLGHPWSETIRIGITLIVSAIPEDLTMILTIALTVGVVRIARRGGVVRQLSAAETLGAATVICVDKTGTLTQGVMQAQGFDFLQGDILRTDTPREAMDELALTGLALANEAYRAEGASQDSSQYFGSATERSALQFVEDSGMSQKSLKSKWRILHAIHFSSAWKYRAVIASHPTQASHYVFAVGAPETLLEASSSALDEEKNITALTSSKRAEISKQLEMLAGSGKRLLAVAVKRHASGKHITRREIQGLSFLGVLMVEDPVRSEAALAISEAQAAGVDVKIITGDHPATAKAVARQVGLLVSGDSVATSDEISSMTDDELSNALRRLTVLARIEPLDKQRIVRLLQQQGHVVAMTGDGINDAVALKGADIGVAMGSGTDVAKDASDMVLLNNSFATITAAIKEGRVLRDNVRKVMAFLLSTNMAEVLIFFGSILLGLPLPLTAAQILWINLVTNGTSDIALSLEGPEEDVMHRGPEDPRRLLFGKHMGRTIGYAGLVMTIATVLVFWFALRVLHAPVEVGRTVTFAFLATTSLLSVWSFRSQRRNMFSAYQANPWVIVSVGFSFLLQLAAMYIPAIRSFFGTVPLSLQQWIVIALLAMVTVIIIDLRKFFWPQMRTHTSSLPGQQKLALLKFQRLWEQKV